MATFSPVDLTIANKTFPKAPRPISLLFGNSKSDNFILSFFEI